MRRLPKILFCLVLEVFLCDGLFIFPDDKILDNGHNKIEKEIGNLLPADCGNVRPTWRLETISARTTELYEYPFYAELIYKNNNENNSPSPFFCGGTLISDRFVLTVASCIKSKPKIVAVRLGDHDLDSNPDCYKDIRNRSMCAPPHLELNITDNDIIIHDLYDHKNYSGKEHYDIALIRLPKPVKFNDAIESVCLPIKPNYRNQGNLTLIGFPRYDKSSPRSNTLLSLAIPHVKNPKCQQLFNTAIDNDYLCAAGRNSKEHCYGYSGSPILYPIVEEYRLRWVLAAIIPDGMDICDPHSIPKVLPRAQKYNEWILENIHKLLN